MAAANRRKDARGIRILDTIIATGRQYLYYADVDGEPELNVLVVQEVSGDTSTVTAGVDWNEALRINAEGDYEHIGAMATGNIRQDFDLALWWELFGWTQIGDVLASAAYTGGNANQQRQRLQSSLIALGLPGNPAPIASTIQAGGKPRFNELGLTNSPLWIRRLRRLGTF